MEQFGRRGFLGMVIGTLASTKIPFIARKPEVPLVKDTVQIIKNTGPFTPGKVRTYLDVSLNGVRQWIDGPPVKEKRVTKNGIEFECEKIEFNAELDAYGMALADCNGNMLMDYRFYDGPFAIRVPGDCIYSTLKVNLYNNAECEHVSNPLHEHLLKTLSDQLQI